MKIDLSKKERWVFLGVGVLVILVLPWLFSRDWGLPSFKDSGEIGDTIGGITAPFLNFFGAILIYLALKAQIEANNQITKQFSTQKIIDYRTNFESSFFNMLSIHHQIVRDIDFEPHRLLQYENSLIDYFKIGANGIKDYYSDIYSQTSNNYSSRDVFKMSLTFLYALLETDLFLNNFSAPSEIKDIKVVARPHEKAFNQISNFTKSFIDENINNTETNFHSIYNYTYGKLSADFGHYFRNLYRIIKMVDEKIFDKDKVLNFKIQYTYTSIIRAQLSDEEIKWLFFNCLSAKGKEKFKPFVEKYSLLKIIDTDNNVYGFYAKYYRECAFKKPDDIDILEHLNQF